LGVRGKGSRRPHNHHLPPNWGGGRVWENFLRRQVRQLTSQGNCRGQSGNNDIKKAKLAKRLFEIGGGEYFLSTNEPGGESATRGKKSENVKEAGVSEKFIVNGFIG